MIFKSKSRRAPAAGGQDEKSLGKINSSAERNYSKFTEQGGMCEYQRYEHGEAETVNGALLIAPLNS